MIANALKYSNKLEYSYFILVLNGVRLELNVLDRV